ncbi:MAG: type II toxin-antitoxin system prevent-host-death family antitoxin [Micrococcales bacterium]|nr:type II toxin-antitoxin system prevent-host-death family antitoxin [Micrococcales bacterium]
MQILGVQQTKTNLSGILAKIEKGESFIIARRGTPVDRLEPREPAAPPKVALGQLQGQIRLPDDFDSWQPEAVTDLFEGSE